MNTANQPSLEDDEPKPAATVDAGRVTDPPDQKDETEEDNRSDTSDDEYEPL